MKKKEKVEGLGEEDWVRWGGIGRWVCLLSGFRNGRVFFCEIFKDEMIHHYSSRNDY